MPLVPTPFGTAAVLRALRSADLDMTCPLLRPTMRIRTLERYHCGMGLSKNAAPHAVGGTSRIRILRVGLERRVEEDDRVAVEAPLEFQLHHPDLGLEPVSF